MTEEIPGPPFAFPALPVQMKTGAERFTDGTTPTDFSLADFWRWGYSSVLENVTRGVLAEYLVAVAVGSDALPRNPWGNVDVTTPEGVTIEVKSCAYIQAWDQSRLSTIQWSCRATRPTSVDGTYADVTSRRTDVWVFALLHHTDQATVDPLDLSQWSFFVVPTWFLNERTRSQSSITLGSLERTEFGDRIPFSRLHEVVSDRARRRESAPHPAPTEEMR